MPTAVDLIRASRVSSAENQKVKSVAKLLFFRILDACGVNALFRVINRGRIKVLMWHSISLPGPYSKNAVTPSDFEQHILYLTENFSVLRLTQPGEILGYDATRVNVLVTFDDGFEDNFSVAAPILDRHNVSAVFFLISSCVSAGMAPRFLRERISDVDVLAEFPTMRADQARELLRRGHCIGSHSVDHLDYALLSAADSATDARAASRSLEAALKSPVTAFAFPWGRYRPEQLTELSGTYLRIFTTDPGFNDVTDTVFFRSEIANSAQLRCAASGSLDFFRKAFEAAAKPFGHTPRGWGAAPKRDD